MAIMNIVKYFYESYTLPVGLWFWDKGAFTIYDYNFPHIFDHPPAFVYNFYDINVYKFSRFLTAHPPSIVNVNCERPLGRVILLWSVELFDI